MKVVVAFCLLTAVTVGQLEIRNRFATVEKKGTVSFVVRLRRTVVIAAVTYTVTPMTYGEFSAMSNVSLPRTLPDPAECKYS